MRRNVTRRAGERRWLSCVVCTLLLASASIPAAEEGNSDPGAIGSFDLGETMIAVRYWPVSRNDYPGYESLQKYAADRNGADSVPGDEQGNGLIDYAEFLLIQVIVNDPSSPLHNPVNEAWETNVARARKDVVPLERFIEEGFVPGTTEDWACLVGGYFTLGDTNSVQYIQNVLAEFTIMLDPENYDTSQSAVLSFEGDADNDGTENKDEYAQALEGKNRKQLQSTDEVKKYVEAALDGGQKQDTGRDEE